MKNAVHNVLLEEIRRISTTTLNPGDEQKNILSSRAQKEYKLSMFVKEEHVILLQYDIYYYKSVQIYRISLKTRLFDLFIPF